MAVSIYGKNISVNNLPHRELHHVNIGGKEVLSSTKITICAFCAKLVGFCMCEKAFVMCTSAGHWIKVKKEYKWKILGRQRLIRYLTNIPLE